MYKVTKPKGFNANVSVENTDTKSSIIIGRLSIDIVNILEKEGIKLPDSYAEEWDFEVEKEVTTMLTGLAMKMKKPVRDQSKKPKDLYPNVKTTSPSVDAFDLIFGQV